MGLGFTLRLFAILSLPRFMVLYLSFFLRALSATDNERCEKQRVSDMALRTSSRVRVDCWEMRS